RCLAPRVCCLNSAPGPSMSPPFSSSTTRRAPCSTLFPYTTLFRSISLAVTSPTLPLYEVRDLIDIRVAQKLSQITGVGLVSVAGGQRPAVRIQANPQALAAHGLTLASLRNAITGANVNQPKGNLDGPQRSTTINANDQLRSREDYENLIVAYENGAALRLKDV